VPIHPSQQILDHSCISILIAGTYTPFCMVSLGHMWIGTALCVAVWVLAVVGVCGRE
jgi:hemolysin III